MVQGEPRLLVYIFYMSKEANITLRLDSDTRQRIAEAARRTGGTLVSFILEAAMHQVNKVEAALPKQNSVPSCPTFFRALCETVQSGGNMMGYNRAARELTKHLMDLQPHDLDEVEWSRRLRQFNHLMEGDLRAGAGPDQILAWFDANLPRGMKLVPEGRRKAFVVLAGCHRTQRCATCC